MNYKTLISNRVSDGIANLYTVYTGLPLIFGKQFIFGLFLKRYTGIKGVPLETLAGNKGLTTFLFGYIKI